MASESPTAPPALPRNGKARAAPLFLLALLIGVGAHVAGFALFHVSVGSARASNPPPPYASYARGSISATSNLRQREAMIADPARLYLPAIVESPQSAVDESARLPLFDSVPANVTVAAEDFHSSASSATLNPIDVLKTRQWDVLGTFGQAASETKPLERRGARLKVTRLAGAATPQVVENFDWPVASAPPESDWRPATFLLVFDEKGLESVALDNSSRSDAVDKFLGTQLREWFARHTQSPGTYTVVVAP